jgi:serine/threonine-protein kinase
MKAKANEPGKHRTTVGYKATEPSGGPVVGGAVLEVPISTPHPVSGTTIGDCYRVVQTLGEGGMGTVLLAHDESLDRDVAIKLVRASLLGGDFAPRLQSEARAMARVRHENVVTVFALGELDETPYIVMEFVPGPDLRSWLDRRGTLGVDEALEVLSQLARGVQAIHDAGVVHHDLKPANVLVGPGMRMAITDLGLAKLLAEQQNTAAAGGTPGYIAPELMAGASVSSDVARRADVYALGVLAYELLTGELPYEGDTAKDTVMLQTFTDPPLASSLRPELSTEFDEPLQRAISRDPHERFASAAELLDAIELARSRASIEPPKPVRIVLADDDAVFRKIAATALKKRIPGAEVVCVSDGTEALGRLDEGGAGLAVVDLHMPGMNGLELTAAIRASDDLRDTRVVIATAVGSATDWRVLSSLGADALLLKPVKVDEIVRTAERLLGIQSDSAT